MTCSSASLSRTSAILLDLLISLLAPMFLEATGGDFKLARMAAAGTINDFRAASKADLIAVAQIVAFGLGSVVAAVASVSTSSAVRQRCSPARCR